MLIMITAVIVVLFSITYVSYKAGQFYADDLLAQNKADFNKLMFRFEQTSAKLYYSEKQVRHLRDANTSLNESMNDLLSKTSPVNIYELQDADVEIVDETKHTFVADFEVDIKDKDDLEEKPVSLKPKRKARAKKSSKKAN